MGTKCVLKVQLCGYGFPEFSGWIVGTNFTVSWSLDRHLPVSSSSAYGLMGPFRSHLVPNGENGRMPRLRVGWRTEGSEDSFSCAFVCMESGHIWIKRSGIYRGAPSINKVSRQAWNSHNTEDEGTVYTKGIEEGCYGLFQIPRTLCCGGQCTWAPAKPVVGVPCVCCVQNL
jgi:hypothetical protein